MRIFKLITLSLLWLIAWLASFEFVTYIVGDALNWYSQVQITAFQCLAANSIKAFLFLIFVYCQLSIVRNALVPNKSLFVKLDFALAYKNRLTALRELKKHKTASIAAINLIWIVYYAFVSLIFLMRTDRFMGDCDVSDIVCAGNGSLYIIPFIALMFIASVAYINSIYITNK
jgi:hypothetical protein